MKKIGNINFYKARGVAKEIAKVIIEKNELNLSDDLVNFLNENRYAPQLIERLTSESRTEMLRNELLLHDKKEEAVQLIQKLRKERKRQTLRKKIIYACSSVASLFILFFALSEFQTPSKNIVVIENIRKDEFKTPTLILENNKQLLLSEDKNDNVINENYNIEKLSSSTLKYKSTKSESLKYNKLIVPAGFSYSVILEDGTEAHLNAGSTLKYPVTFNNNSREVELEGEAYFKVTKSKIPFIVKTNEIKVQVYGTEFNIYSGKGIIETVLVEGSVGVLVDGKEQMITPNQLCTFNQQSGEITVKDIDVYEHIAWRDDQFVYENKSLSRIFYDLSVWYNVKFNLPSDKQNVEVTAVLNRASKMEDIVPFIEQLINLKIINNGKGVYTVE